MSLYNNSGESLTLDFRQKMPNLTNPSRGISLAKFAVFAALITGLIFLSATPDRFRRSQVEEFPVLNIQRAASEEGSNLIQISNGENHTADARLPDAANLPIVHLRNYLPNAYLYPHLAKPYNASVLAFLHNPKSGGTSVRDCMLGLHRAMHKDRPVVVATATLSGEKEKLLNHVTPTNDYYMGDAALGICDTFGDRPCSYFTVVREPYERMVSHYYFCKSGGPGWPPCDNTLEEFTLSLCSLFFRQLTVQVFCKEDNQNPSSPWKCDRMPVSIDHLPEDQQQRTAILDYFLANVDKIFAVIGLTEEFETSLKLFENTFGEPFYGLCNEKHSNAGSYKNVTDTDNTKADRKRITAEAKERLMKNEQIRQCLHEDIQLYNKMYGIFQKQKQYSNIV